MSYSMKFNPSTYGEIESILDTITPFDQKAGQVFEFSFPSFSQAKKARSLLYDWRSHHRTGRTAPFQIRETFLPAPGFAVIFRTALTVTLESIGRSLGRNSNVQLLTELTKSLIGTKNPFEQLAPLFLEGTISLKEGIFILQELLKAIGQDSPFTPSMEEVKKVVLEAGKEMGLEAEIVQETEK